MSKVSSADYPTYSGGNVSVNGNSVASTNLVNGVLNSNYNMSDNEKAIYDYAQSTLANILPQLNVFDANTQSSIQSQLDAYKGQGVQTINDMYTPMIKSLQNDIAARFGNFDNSIFMNNLNGIESNRGEAVNSLAQDLLAKRSELVSDELNKRYTYADFLNNLQSQSYNNALSAISAALGGSSSANSYNNNLYNTLYKQSLQGQGSTGDITSLLTRALGINSGGSFL